MIYFLDVLEFLASVFIFRVMILMGSEKFDRLSDQPSGVLLSLSSNLPIFPMILVSFILSYVNLEPDL